MVVSSSYRVFQNWWAKAAALAFSSRFWMWDCRPSQHPRSFPPLPSAPLLRLLLDSQSPSRTALNLLSFESSLQSSRRNSNPLPPQRTRLDPATIRRPKVRLNLRSHPPVATCYTSASLLLAITFPRQTYRRILVNREVRSTSSPINWTERS